MSGNRTFQTAGVRVTTGPAGFSDAGIQALGSGVTVAYTASSDSYTLTAPDNTTATFAPSDVVPSAAPNAQVWMKPSVIPSEAPAVEQGSLTLAVPVVNGVPLSYTIFGSWAYRDAGQPRTWLAVGGVPTVASDMPRTGGATYSMAAGGAAFQPGAAPITLDGYSTATFSADFAGNSVTTALTLAGQPSTAGPISTGPSVIAFGTFSGTGTIAGSGPGFTGTLSGANGAAGSFSGAFFGPAAREVGYAWFLNGAGFSAVGGAAGVKR
jgi:hypothetical protein